MIAAASGPNDFWILLALLSCFVGIVFTPIALWMAYRQLRSDPAARGRDLVLKSAIVYGTIAPILLVLLAAEATNGAAPMLFGIAAFFYAQYHLLRRLWKYLSDSLPTPPSASTNQLSQPQCSVIRASGNAHAGHVALTYSTFFRFWRSLKILLTCQKKRCSRSGGRPKIIVEFDPTILLRLNRVPRHVVVEAKTSSKHVEAISSMLCEVPPRPSSAHPFFDKLEQAISR